MTHPDPAGRSGSDEVARSREAVAALARPRLAGSEGAARAAGELERRFSALGYAIRPLRFTFSTWPGRFGVPAAGAVYLAGMLFAARLLLAGRAPGAIATLLLLAAAIATLAALARIAIGRLPWGRVPTANWLVHEPGAQPEYVMMAHRDSKSQAVSLELRIAAIGGAALAYVGLFGTALLVLARPGLGWAPVVALFGLASLAAGIGLLGCLAANRSPGALDNATGLAALLGLARRERGHADVAFLVTDGEELGLAGAWALAPHLPALQGVINLDGLDDEGPFHVMERYGWPSRGVAPHLAAALLAAAQQLGFAAERRSLPIGVLVDHIPIAEAGVPALTLMRGTRQSLQRTHRPADSADLLTGEGVAATVDLVAAALAVLRRSHGETARIATPSEAG